MSMKWRVALFVMASLVVVAMMLVAQELAFAVQVWIKNYETFLPIIVK
jgi:hypothetical protein